jgi:ribonuclease HII
MGQDRVQKEKDMYDKMLEYERLAHHQGYVILSGVDEAGRGPLAGPVVAAVCILDPERPIYGLNDSKKLTPSSRSRLYHQIVENAVEWQVGIVGPEIIDEINILQATCQAMRQAIQKLVIKPDLLLIDAVRLSETNIPVWPIIRGDGLSVSIAAASIIAKVTRDRMMDGYDVQYPEYGFIQHKGYGTESHYTALRQYGPCPIHRRTFLRSILEPDADNQSKKKNNHVVDERQISLFSENEQP